MLDGGALDLRTDFCHALDACAFVEDRLAFRADPWQAQLLRSTSQWVMLSCCRQSGKTTATALLALWTALYIQGLILCISPSLRQSKLLFAKIIAFLRDLQPAEVFRESPTPSEATAPGFDT